MFAFAFFTLTLQSRHVKRTNRNNAITKLTHEESNVIHINHSLRPQPFQCLQWVGRTLFDEPELPVDILDRHDII